MFSTYEYLFVFDFETSGLDFQKDKPIELGGVLMKRNPETKKFEVIEEIDEFVKIGYPLPEIIVNLTHITDHMLDTYGIEETDLYWRLKNILDKKPLMIGYNVQFDMNFVLNLMRRYEDNYECTCDMLDVMAIYKDRHSYPHRLESAIETYHVLIPNSHRAIDDCKATLEVLKEMAKEQNNIDHYVNLFGFNPKYGVSGERFKKVTYVPQYGNKRELEKMAG